MAAAEAQAPALAQDKRVALVIGNSAYVHAAELGNPRNDAVDLTAALEKSGFTVVSGLDLDRAAMNQTIRRFADALGGAEVGVFFYAGHGLQVGGQNYLVPIDAKLEDASGLDFELVRLDVVQRAMEGQTRTNILFLDACRNNPLARNLARAMGTRAVGIGRGLAIVESGVGTLISFSTQPGNVALDGDGRNSPFAGALVRQLARPGVDISDMLISVRRDVMRETADRQVPWEHSALTARFQFSRPSAAAGAAAPPDQASEELRHALADARRAQESQRIAEQQREAAMRAADEARKAAALAALSSKVTGLPAPERPPPPADTDQLARDLQRELKRVGCDPGAIDGNWGRQSQAALQKFAGLTKLALLADEPTHAALDAVTAQKILVCPRECGSGEVLDRQGNCIARPPSPPKPSASRSTDAGSEKATGGELRPRGGLCKDGNMNHCRVACANGFEQACRRLQRGR